MEYQTGDQVLVIRPIDDGYHRKFEGSTARILEVCDDGIHLILGPEHYPAIVTVEDVTPFQRPHSTKLYPLKWSQP